MAFGRNSVIQFCLGKREQEKGIRFEKCSWGHTGTILLRSIKTRTKGNSEDKIG